MYEGSELTEISPSLKAGKKIHYPIYHDETCIHANNQSNFVWMRDGKQPLWGKSHGCLVHVSDFIIEHSRRLWLNEAEIKVQERLSACPLPPLPACITKISSNVQPEAKLPPVMVPDTQDKSSVALTKGKGEGKSKQSKPKVKKKAKNTKKTMMEGQTYAAHQSNWVPPPPPVPFTSYCLSSYDAWQIIYSRSNYDPWWDMPWLISQVFVT